MIEARHRRAAGLTESVVALVLIAIAVLAAVKAYGFRVQEKYDETAVEVQFEVN